jgi:hypothetical protein
LWFSIPPIYKKILSKIRSIVKNIKIKQTDSVKEASSRDLKITFIFLNWLTITNGLIKILQDFWAEKFAFFKLFLAE